MTRRLCTLIAVLLGAACGTPRHPPARADAGVDTLATSASLALEIPIAVRPLPGGRVVLLDYKASKVFILDSAGALLETFGAPGKGPGEFLMAYGLTTHGDTLAVFDIGNGRLVNFLPGRGFVGVRPLPNGFAHQAFVLLDGDTTLHMTDGVDSALAVLRAPSGAVLARYGTPIAPPVTLFYFGRMKQAAAEGRVPDEFKNNVLPVIGPSRDVWIIQQATGRIEHFAPDGRLLGNLELPADHVAGRVQEFLRQSREVASDPGRIGGIAMVTGAYADADGLWLLLAQPDSVPAQLLMVDSSCSIKAMFTVPGAAGASSLSRDRASGRFYLLNMGEGILLRLTLPQKDGV
jgi:hypothetical protein